MSIQIRKAIILNQKEQDLIVFVRTKMPYGRCTLVTHAGLPERVEDIRRANIFGNGEKKENEGPRQEKSG